MNHNMDIEAMFKEYYPQLKYFGRKYIDDPSVVEDIVMDTIIKVSKCDCRNVGAMLYTSVKNGRIDHLKKSKKETEANKYYINQIYTETDQLESELLNKLYLIVRDLPEKDRKLLNLFFFENKSSIDVGRILNKSDSTVRTLKQFLLKKIRELMNPR